MDQIIGGGGNRHCCELSKKKTIDHLHFFDGSLDVDRRGWKQVLRRPFIFMIVNTRILEELWEKAPWPPDAMYMPPTNKQPKFNEQPKTDKQPETD